MSNEKIMNMSELDVLVAQELAQSKDLSLDELVAQNLSPNNSMFGDVGTRWLNGEISDDEFIELSLLHGEWLEKMRRDQQSSAVYNTMGFGAVVCAGLTLLTPWGMAGALAIGVLAFGKLTVETEKAKW